MLAWVDICRLPGARLHHATDQRMTPHQLAAQAQHSCTLGETPCVTIRHESVWLGMEMAQFSMPHATHCLHNGTADEAEPALLSGSVRRQRAGARSGRWGAVVHTESAAEDYLVFVIRHPEDLNSVRIDGDLLKTPWSTHCTAAVCPAGKVMLKSCEQARKSRCVMYMVGQASVTAREVATRKDYKCYEYYSMILRPCMKHRI